MFMFRKMLLATTATILLTGPALAAPIDTNRRVSLQNLAAPTAGFLLLGGGSGLAHRPNALAYHFAH